MGARVGEEKGDGAIVSAGVGLRQQVGYQSVIDIGLKGNLATGNGERSEVSLVTGYSLFFLTATPTYYVWVGATVG